MIDQRLQDLVDANNLVLNTALEDLKRLTESVGEVTLSAHDALTIELASKVLSRLIAAQRIHLGPPDEPTLGEGRMRLNPDPRTVE
jgi:hypothetical protein